ncbi:hypothetical protein CIB48_g46 [Xylaria polymorpha]|nr:hypothetical protein CIB48_g46 [Xylaria polymorpha]
MTQPPTLQHAYDHLLLLVKRRKHKRKQAIKRAMKETFQQKLSYTKNLRRTVVQNNYVKVHKSRIEQAVQEIKIFRRRRHICWEWAGTMARPCPLIPEDEVRTVNSFIGLLKDCFEHQRLFKSLGELEECRTRHAARAFLSCLFEALRKIKRRVARIEDAHEEAWKKELRHSRGAHGRRVRSAKLRATHSLAVGVTTPRCPSPLRQVTGVNDGDAWDALAAYCDFS